ncbi:DUF4176 domain-containing protein [Streptococcus acidominimus]|uniref:EsaC protein analog (Listeria type 3) n=1 Tax=Streptococcus acidominimus TaxID=1326 RepID=A0A1Q8EEU1_STRAI|nr:DUF4176 domain-containing protein [Streptococcus acidominimus]OLF50319.1 hypothetical protein BU200_02845 [Streptococcus acidominimus]SUN06997.1 Putative EsaC protein analog (Listeria type 3) [Streptococcus acidominimus]
MDKKWLSLGTTVLLKNGSQPIMIVGRYQQNREGTVFDYSGVLNPQGFEDAQTMYLFNESKIEQILFESPHTTFEMEFISKLNEFISHEEI